MSRIADGARLGGERRALLWRARFKHRELSPVVIRTDRVCKDDVLVAFCARNEAPRLPYFFEYYRALGANHFFAIDNGSSDESLEFLSGQADCSVWRTDASYQSARFGMDWINSILNRHGRNHWVLVVDPDEFFVYPHMTSRPLTALLDWLDAGHLRSFGAMLVDMYPRHEINRATYSTGADPLLIAPYFDAFTYRARREPFYHNVWLQGGPRERVFFADRPSFAPALNKIPLVKWAKGIAFRSSTHQLLPRSLNRTHQSGQNPNACGALLHFKFLEFFAEKSKEDLSRKQHYASGREYRAYTARQETVLWTEESQKYTDWRQLEELGLMSRGDWA
ncbi:MAG: glycosyltransferase family 2 protein [Pseudomonadota bacterium]